MEILKEDQGGKNSSKKAAGLLMLISCVIIVFVDLLTDNDLNAMAFTTLFGGGMVLVGARWIKDVVQKK